MTDDEVLLTPAPITASGTPASTASSVLTTQAPTSNQPFYFDFRYQVLLVDGGLILVMVIILTIRLLSKAVGPTTAEETAQTPDPNRLKTVDQLNIDIPL